MGQIFEAMLAGVYFYLAVHAIGSQDVTEFLMHLGQRCFRGSVDSYTRPFHQCM